MLQKEKSMQSGVDIALTIIIFAIVIFVFREVGGFFAKRQYQTYQLDIDARMNTGLTRAQAVAQEQDMANSMRTASAITAAGSSIGFGILDR